MSPAALGIAVAVLAIFWLCGGLALRVGGALLGLVGVCVSISSGDPAALGALALGALAWLAGQAHHLLRHGEAKGPLARRVLSGHPAASEPSPPDTGETRDRPARGGDCGRQANHLVADRPKRALLTFPWVK